MFNFLKPAPAIEPIPKEKVPKAYKRYRIQVFLSIYIGYSLYYFLRRNFTISKVYLIEQGFSKSQIGFVASALGLAYGVSKFVMGNLSDRSNARYFLAIGLILSGISNLFIPSSTNIEVMFLLMLLNGLFQGMGWPPCAKTMVYWFSKQERDLKTSILSTAHNIGGGFAATIVLIGISLFGSWKGSFYFPAIIAICGGFLYILFARDTPQSVGLPPIEEFKNDYQEVCKEVDDKETKLTGKEILFKHILSNKLIWCIAFANIFVYFLRYGISNWALIFLQEVRGFNMNQASNAFAIFEYAAIPGTIMVGWISSRLHNCRHNLIAILCMICVTILTFIYWNSQNIFIINSCLALIGAFIYAPVMIILLMSMTFVPKEAVGTSSGFTSLFGYLGGQVLSESVIGSILDKFSWDGCFILLIVSCLLAIFFFLLTYHSNNIIGNT